MASPADAIAYAASGGWDQATVLQVVYWLRTGQAPDSGLSEQAHQAINDIYTMGLSALGVSQLDYYLSHGAPPPDLSYTDESAEVLGVPAETAAPVAAPEAPANTAPPTGPTAQQQSARAIIDSTLSEFGLSGIGDRVWNAVTSGQIVPEQITQFIRQTDEYKQRFVGMSDLQKKGRAISEAEYISVERSYSQVLRAAGLPSGFYDSPDDFARLIGGEVSASELADRVQAYTQVAFESPPEVRDQLQRLYGIGPGELTAYFIDPERALPIIRQQARAAQLSGAASASGFGALERGEAERLAQLGVTDQQAREGFGALVDARELFAPLDAGEGAIGRGEQIGGALGGDSVARRKIEERRRRRQAQFEGGGGYASSKSGFSGIGSAS